MSNLCFFVSSITNAMRGKSILEKNGIRAFISRITDDTIRNGCGYCLIVTGSFEAAEKLLRSAGIRIREQSRMDEMP